jgi:hypothetical protein
LANQHRSRRREDDLVSGDGGQGCRAQRDLGLAVANVADDQAVHRPARGEIIAHGLDSAHLVSGFVERKGRDELLVFGGVGLDDRRFEPASLFCQTQQFAGALGDGFVDRPAPLLPARAVELVERHRVAIRAVTPQSARIVDGNETPVAASIFQRDQFFASIARCRLEADNSPDTMILVDDEIAGANVASGQLHPGHAQLDLAHDRAAAEKIGRSDHREVFGTGTTVDWRDKRRHTAGGQTRQIKRVVSVSTSTLKVLASLGLRKRMSRSLPTSRRRCPACSSGEANCLSAAKGALCSAKRGTGDASVSGSP